MGSHFCEYCMEALGVDNVPEAYRRKVPKSSGDVIFVFEEGSWQMPDMIVHYVEKHRFRPPDDFISSVMQGQIDRQEIDISWDDAALPKVGYLSEPFNMGDVPEGFLDCLTSHMEVSEDLGRRRQTRGG